MAFWDYFKDFFRRLFGIRAPPIPPPIPPPPPAEKYYRNSKVRMYYAKEVKRTGTPTPFAEFRVFMVTKIPMNLRILNREFDKKLDEMEFIFKTFAFAKAKGNLSFIELNETEMSTIRNRPEIQTFLLSRGEKAKAAYDYITITGKEENVLIDKDEAELTFFTTGLIQKDRRGKWIIGAEYGEIYRYFALFDEMGDIDHDYNEFEIRQVHEDRIREYEEWKSEKMRSGGWVDWIEWQLKKKGEE
jgi:hypothetical protein